VPEAVQAPSGSPPPRLVSTRGRPRQGETSAPFCPPPPCAERGWVGLGHLRANGPPTGGPWRPGHGPSCGGDVCETHGTRVPGQRGSVELIVRGLTCRAEGWGIRGTARGLEVAPTTGLQWLGAAAEPLQAFSRHVRHDVHVRQVPLDALFALLSAVQDGAVNAAEAIARLERSPQGVWVALDPERQRRLALDGGDRPLAMAQRVGHQVVQGCASGCGPWWLMDGLQEDATALLSHVGSGVHPPRRQAPGPAPHPRWRPLPALREAPVVQTVRRRRLVDVTPRGVFGPSGVRPQGRAVCGWQITTALVERVNLTLRQPGAAMGRRGTTLCQGEAGVRQQLAVDHGS
jgi:hypothetical protein